MTVWVMKSHRGWWVTYQPLGLSVISRLNYVTKPVSIHTTMALRDPATLATSPVQRGSFLLIDFLSEDTTVRRRGKALFRREIKLIGWRLSDRSSRQHPDVTTVSAIGPPTTTTCHTNTRHNTLFSASPTDRPTSRQRSISRV